MMYGSDINGTRNHTTEWFDHEGHHLHFIILLPDIFTFRALTNPASIISAMRSQIMTIRELQNIDDKQLHYMQIQIIPYQRTPGINCVNVFSYTVKAEVNSNHNKLGKFVAGTFPYDDKVSKTQHGSRIDYDDPEIRRRAINMYLFPEKYFPNDKHSAIPPWVKAYRYRHKAAKTSRERLKIENEFIRHVRSTTGDASVFRAKPIPISDAKPLPAFRPNL